MGKPRPSRKIILEIDLLRNQAKLVDNYKKIVETDIKTIMQKLGLL